MCGVPDTDLVVDATGLYCPIPILRLAKALRGVPAGTVALLLATDPAATEDVEVFCRERSHELIESRRHADIFSFRVRKGSGLAP
jgi:tRNA 2-thiouridine synthesizing protein A